MSPPPTGTGPDAGSHESDAPDDIAVTVAWATPTAQDVVALRLPAGATVGDAVARSALAGTWGFEAGRASFAVAGHRVRADTRLRAGDRVDVLRPLTVDPREARRRRAEARRPADER